MPLAPRRVEIHWPNKVKWVLAIFEPSVTAYHCGLWFLCRKGLMYKKRQLGATNWRFAFLAMLALIICRVKKLDRMRKGG